MFFKNRTNKNRKPFVSVFFCVCPDKNFKEKIVFSLIDLLKDLKINTLNSAIFGK